MDEPLLIEYHPAFRTRSWFSEYRDIVFLENCRRMKNLEEMESKMKSDLDK